MPVPDSRAYWSMGEDGEWHAVNVSALAPTPTGKVYGPIPEPPRLAAMEAVVAGIDDNALMDNAESGMTRCRLCRGPMAVQPMIPPRCVLQHKPDCPWRRAQEPSDATP